MPKVPPTPSDHSHSDDDRAHEHKRKEFAESHEWKESKKGNLWRRFGLLTISILPDKYLPGFCVCIATASVQKYLGNYATEDDARIDSYDLIQEFELGEDATDA